MCRLHCEGSLDNSQEFNIVTEFLICRNQFLKVNHLLAGKVRQLNKNTHFRTGREFDCDKSCNYSL